MREMRKAPWWLQALRMQEMAALSNHHLKTHKQVQHILVTQLQTTFSPLISSDVFPGLHRMMQTRRNPKVDFEELPLPLQQDPAICTSCPGAPLHPPAVITEQKTILILAIIATSHTTANDPLVCSTARKCPLSSFLLTQEGP